MISINNKYDCCGCSACESICSRNAITMISDKEGFTYPQIDKKLCINCGLCNTVCPLQKRKQSILSSNYIDIFALRLKDENNLKNSSSGGAFFALAQYIIENRGYVVGAVYNGEMEVVHTIASTITEVSKMRGSKYSQSNIRGIYAKVKQLLREGNYVLFTGTPCQTDGLKSYLRKDYEKLFTMDVVCHAVPSPLIFNEYVKFVNKKLNKSLVSIGMRDKERGGWSHRFSYRYVFSDGSVSIDNSQIHNWGKIYFSKLVDRPSCHKCMYSNYCRPSDITVADLWDDKCNRPDIYSKEGTSLFIINTEKGKALFDSIKRDVYYWRISKEDSWQPCLESPTVANKKRDFFWKYYHKNGFEKTYHKFFDDPFKLRIKRVIKGYLIKYRIIRRNGEKN